MMKIDIYTDFVCPFCYIGKTELENAIKAMDLEDVDIAYKAFEINPGASKEPGTSYMDHVYARFPSEDFAKVRVIDPLIERAKSLGLAIDFYELDEANTFDAHRILKLAEEKNLSKEFLDEAFKRVFEDNVFLADHGVLIEIGESVGLGEDDIRKVLGSDKYADKVRKDEETARSMGVGGVPFFVFDNKYSLSGAQPEAVFKKALEKVIEESKPVDLGEASGLCGIDGCE